MFDSTIHAKTLARHLRKDDFANSFISNQAQLDDVINRAAALGLTGFSSISIEKNSLRGKTIYQITDLAETLVLRHITSNIRSVTSVKQDDRQFIVTCLKMMLSQGTSFRVYKFDIASFYENVSPQGIIEKLERDTAFSGQSIRALHSFFGQLGVAGIPGLPRGVSLSATLAEYLLRDFDKTISNQEAVWFYARFVDDVVIITSGQEIEPEFRRFVAENLPQGLEFNQKSRSVSFSIFHRNNRAAQENCFDFLGYRFSVSLVYKDNTHSNNIRRRDTWMDIAPSKVRRLKTKLAKSLLAYRKDADFELLLARVRLLTSNFNFIDLKTGVRRSSGIYFNYPLVSSERSTALPELDKYLFNAITSPHPKNILRPILTSQQRQMLLNLSFRDGFKNKRFFWFKAARLATLTACWAYA
jgi:hypothetical protein